MIWAGYRADIVRVGHRHIHPGHAAIERCVRLCEIGYHSLVEVNGADERGRGGRDRHRRAGIAVR